MHVRKCHHIHTPCSVIYAVGTEGPVVRFFFARFKCFRKEPSFVYSKLAQQEADDDVDFSVDGKGAMCTIYNMMYNAWLNDK